MASQYPEWVKTNDQKDLYVDARAYGLDSNDVILKEDSSCRRYVDSKRQLLNPPLPINNDMNVVVEKRKPKLDKFVESLGIIQPNNSRFIDNLTPPYGLFERDLTPLIEYINSEISVKTKIALKSNHKFGLLSLYSGFSKTMLLCALLNHFNTNSSETFLIYITFNQQTAKLPIETSLTKSFMIRILLSYFYPYFHSNMAAHSQWNPFYNFIISNFQVDLDVSFFELIVNHYKKRFDIQSKINLVVMLDEYHKMDDEKQDDPNSFKVIFIFSGLDSLPLKVSALKSNIEVYYIPVTPLTFEIATAIATKELGDEEFLLNESARILVWALSSNPKRIVEVCKLVKNRNLKWEDQLSSILAKVDDDRVSDTNLNLFFSLIAAHFSRLPSDRFINDHTLISRLNIVIPQIDGKVIVSIYGLMIGCKYHLDFILPPGLLKFGRLLKSVYSLFNESFSLMHPNWKKLELHVAYLLSCIINSYCLTILPNSCVLHTATELFFDIVFPTVYILRFNLCPVEIVIDLDINASNNFDPGHIFWWNGAQVGIDTLGLFVNSFISNKLFDIFIFIQDKLVYDSGLTLATYIKCRDTCISITSKYSNLNLTKNVAYLLIIIDSVKDVSTSLKKELTDLNNTHNKNNEFFAALGRKECKNFSTSMPRSPCIPLELYINADNISLNIVMLFLPDHWAHRKEIASEICNLKEKNYYHFDSWSDICTIATSLYPDRSYEVSSNPLNFESVKFKKPSIAPFTKLYEKFKNSFKTGPDLLTLELPEIVANFLKNNKLKLKEVEGDGNCFYSSILPAMNFGFNVKGIRESISAFVYYNWSYLECYITDNEKRRGKILFVDSIKNSRWADNIEILAFTLLYKREIRILHPDVSVNIINGADVIDVSPINIYYNGVNHYYLLVKDSKKRKKSNT